MVKALDFRSDGGSACRFDSRHGRFYYLTFFYDDDDDDDDDRATCSSAGEREAQRQRTEMSAPNVGASVFYIWGE